MTSTDNRFDAVVIGAGAGGLLTAARLAKRGFRTLVVERLDKVGGRASRRFRIKVQGHVSNHCCGTFTITNTGSHGALFYIPILNQPQSGILGTGAVVERVVPQRDRHGGYGFNVRSIAHFSIT